MTHLITCLTWLLPGARLLLTNGQTVRSLFDGIALANWRYFKQKDTPAPWCVSLLSFCEQFSALPESGGILDQDPGMMEALSLTRYVKWLNASDAKTWKTEDLRFKGALDRGTYG